MKNIVYAQTGEVKEGDRSIILKSGAVGSCIVVTAYNKEFMLGAMAHILLPGKAPDKKNIAATKYAQNAVHKLLEIFLDKRIELNELEVCVAGGANVLNRSNDEICKSNIESVNEILEDTKVKVQACSLGGILRRSVSLDIETGKLYLSVGDQKEKIFLKFGK
jgi:chemotaxis protein CheD